MKDFEWIFFITVIIAPICVFVLAYTLTRLPEKIKTILRAKKIKDESRFWVRDDVIYAYLYSSSGSYDVFYYKSSYSKSIIMEQSGRLVELSYKKLGSYDTVVNDSRDKRMYESEQERLKHLAEYLI